MIVMDLRTGFLALALVLCWPKVAPAQSITLKSGSIRLFAQPSGFVLGSEKRVYTSYFNSLRTQYVAVEATLEYAPATEAVTVSIGCSMTRPDGRVIDGIFKIPARIAAGSTRAVGANALFGPGKEGWQKGVYKVLCSASRPVDSTSFQMSPGPSLLGDSELRLASVKFFPTGKDLPAVAGRKYDDRFSSAETSRIAIELSFVHQAFAKDAETPIDCYLLNSASTVFGRLNFSYKPEPGATSGTAASWIGYDQPGKWPTGDYLAICQMHGRPISVDRFTVW